jgi:hypothetical protein
LISLLFFSAWASLAPVPIVSRTALPGKPDETFISAPRNHFAEPTKQTGNRAGVHRYATKRRLEAPGGYQMNHSIHSADRATHMKIVVVALVAGICVAAFGIAARTNIDYSQTAAHVIKAGKPVVVTSSDTSRIR